MKPEEDITKTEKEAAQEFADHLGTNAGPIFNDKFKQKVDDLVGKKARMLTPNFNIRQLLGEHPL